MSELIITHPGKAHFDEFLSISLILAVNHTTNYFIERREPKPEELDNPDIWVIDIGGRYEPDLKNFDHHQDLDIGVSFVLVADYLNLTDKLKTTPWWSFKDQVDRFGPVKTAKAFNLETLEPTHSPLEIWFLSLFEKSPLMVYHLMHLFGKHLIERADELNELLKFWPSCETITIKNKLILIGYTKESKGLEEYSNTLDRRLDVAVTYDPRGTGWKIRRFDDSKGVNFAILENHPDISFAHKGGFIAKTKTRLDLEKVLELVSLGIS